MGCPSSKPSESFLGVWFLSMLATCLLLYSLVDLFSTSSGPPLPPLRLEVTASSGPNRL